MVSELRARKYWYPALVKGRCLCFPWHKLDAMHADTERKKQAITPHDKKREASPNHTQHTQAPHHRQIAGDCEVKGIPREVSLTLTFKASVDVYARRKGKDIKKEQQGQGQASLKFSAKQPPVKSEHEGKAMKKDTAGDDEKGELVPLDAESGKDMARSI